MMTKHINKSNGHKQDINERVKTSGEWWPPDNNNWLGDELDSDKNDDNAVSLFCIMWTPPHICQHVGDTRRGVEWWRSDLD